MALNRTKVLEAAQKYLQKGQHDKAIAEYQKLVKEDPRDVRTLLKIGDLYTRRGNRAEAIHTYGAVAEQYAKQGFFLKAVAVYKQILKLDPEQLDVCEKLAAMYEELALVSDALSTYEMVSDRYMKAGDTNHAVDTIQKMVDLDPDNIAVRIKFAETLSRANRTEEAAEAFGSGATLLKEQGRMDDYIRVAERQLYHQPGNVTLAEELATLYLERKDAKRALAKLQLCFKDNPRDIRTLEMLAEAFRQLGQGTKTISVLREIARIHAEMGADEPRRRALARILDLDPDDEEARQALGLTARGKERKFGATLIDQRSPEERAEDAARRAEEEQALAEGMLDEDDSDYDDDLLLDEEDEEVLIVDEDGSAASSLPSESPPTRRERERERERAPENKDQRVARLMAEADVKAAAGLWLEVEGLLKEVLELNADEVPARERLKDLYLELERNDDAVAELMILADAWVETDVDRAIGYTQHAVRLAPADPRPKLRLEALQEQQQEVAFDPLEQPIALDDFERPARPSAEAEQQRSVPELTDLLDAPIQDDFGAPASSPPTHLPKWNSGPLDRKSTLAESLPRPSDVDGLLDGTLSSKPISAPPPRRASAPSRPAYDALLEAPIDDDFGAPPPPSGSHSTTGPSMADLLNRPIGPDDFGTGDAPAGRASDPKTLDPLTQPLQDDFGPPPARPQRQHTLAQLETLLSAPIEDDFSTKSRHGSTETTGLDDFGLTDDRFDQSDALEVSELLPGQDQAAPAMADDTGAHFSDVDTGDVQLVEAIELASADPYGEVTALGPVPEEYRLASQAEQANGDLPTKQRRSEVPDSARRPTQHPPKLPNAPADETSFASLAPGSQQPSEAASADEISFADVVPTAPPPRSRRETPLPDLSAPQTPIPPAPGPTARPVPAGISTRPPAAEVEEEQSVSPEIEETIDEADFFYAQGMYDDAIEAVQEALVIYPGSKALQEKLDEYELAASESGKAEDEGLGLADESFALAEQLADELGGEPADAPSEAVDVEQVFAQFKKGVAEQISQDDSSTHFDLGIAYKEMGLVDDAIGEFRIAAADRNRTCISLTMIGMCLLEQGKAKVAIEEFQRALVCEVKDLRTDLGLHYEIGMGYEMLGEVRQALDAFARVEARDPTFREVGAKLRALRTRAADENTHGDDSVDLDRAFDDLMGDSDP